MLTTPAIRALSRARPGAHLTYLVEPQAAPVVAQNPHLNDVIVAPLRHGFARVREDASLALRLRRERFDAVLDFHGGPRSSLLAWATGAPVRIGYVIKGRGWMYTRRIARPRGHRPRHSVENQWDLVEALVGGLERPTPQANPVEMVANAAADGRMSSRLASWGFAPTDDLVVVHVGAGNEFRRWPESAFGDVAALLLAANPNRRIILTTGPAQAARAEDVRRIAQARGAAPTAVVVACDLDLAELRSLVARAAVFVGGDSGPAHVASTTATPMVVIFGPTTPVVWGPWRDPELAMESVDVGTLPCRPCDQRTCEPGDYRCLRTISPGTVAAAAERVLARARSAGERTL
ncbi:MAG: glycosyltransferase family 9 protein [Acidobacteria bacterium]|nr:glycosyltransferase family 9 protein [Acidobacteriota bacterium]